MRIYTKIVVSWGGEVIESESYEYSGPLALCDRSLTASGKQDISNLNTTAGNAGAQAGGISGKIVPTLEQYAAGNGPGLGPFGLGAKETVAAAEGSAESGKAAEQTRLNATRTGNAAGVGAGVLGGIQEGARTTGSAIQRALDANNQARLQQQQMGMSGAEGILGDYMKQQSTAEGQVAPAIDSTLAAGRQGWLQNTEGVLGTLGKLGSQAAGAYGSIYGGGGG